MKTVISIGQIVHDRARPASKGAAIVIGISKRSGQFRICRWRGAQQHWSLPVSVNEKQLERIVDWTTMPLTKAKRLASAAFEHNYLVLAMESAKGSVVDAALLAGVDPRTSDACFSGIGSSDCRRPSVVGEPRDQIRHRADSGKRHVATLLLWVAAW